MSELPACQPNGISWSVDSLLDWCAVPGNLSLVIERDKPYLVSDKSKFQVRIGEVFLRISGQYYWDTVIWGLNDLSPGQCQKLLAIINQAKIDRIFGSGS